MSIVIAYLIAVIGFNMDADKPVKILADLLKSVDGEKVATGLKELLNSPAWHDLVKAGMDFFQEFMKAW